MRVHAFTARHAVSCRLACPHAAHTTHCPLTTPPQAIERVNDLDPEILEHREELFFHLQQQRLIELVRQGQLAEALEFAQENLAPRGEEHPELLEELGEWVGRGGSGWGGVGGGVSGMGSG